MLKTKKTVFLPSSSSDTYSEDEDSFQVLRMEGQRQEEEVKYAMAEESVNVILEQS
jgi:hypothetical protein